MKRSLADALKRTARALDNLADRIDQPVADETDYFSRQPIIERAIAIEGDTAGAEFRQLSNGNYDLVVTVVPAS